MRLTDVTATTDAKVVVLDTKLFTKVNQHCIVWNYFVTIKILVKLQQFALTIRIDLIACIQKKALRMKVVRKWSYSEVSWFLTGYLILLGFQEPRWLTIDSKLWTQDRDSGIRVSSKDKIGSAISSRESHFTRRGRNKTKAAGI